MSAETNLTASVRALAAARQLTQGDVADAIGIKRSTFERRLAHGGWTIAEAERVSLFFDVPLGELTNGLQGQLVGE